MKDRAVQDIPIESINCRPQVRVEFDEAGLVGLAQSIKENGVLQPLLAHREGVAFILDDGERRLRAAKRAGLTTVPVIVDDRDLCSTEVLQRQLVLDCQRVELNAMERARAIDRLMQETKWTAAQVSLKLGMSPAQVSKLLALLLLPPDVQNRVMSGKLAASTAYEIAKLPDAKQREQLGAEAVDGHLTRDGAVARTKSLNSIAKPRRSRTRQRVTLPLGEGRVVCVSGSQLTLEGLVTWFEDLLGKLRNASTDGLALAAAIKSLSGK